MKPGSFPVKDSLTGEGSPGAGQLPPLVEIRNVTSYCPGACKAQPSQAHRLRTLSGSTPWMAGSPTEGPPVPPAVHPWSCSLCLFWWGISYRTQNSVQLTEAPRHEGLLESESNLSTWGSPGGAGPSPLLLACFPPPSKQSLFSWARNTRPSQAPSRLQNAK